jgi:hypothetical protein
LALVASATAQIVGFVGAVIVGIALVGGVPMRGGASAGRGLTSTFRGKTSVQAEPQVLDEAPVDEAAWQRERERREANFLQSGAAHNDSSAESHEAFGAKPPEG